MKMKKIFQKPGHATERLRRLAELTPAPLSARDPVAFAAALQVLG
jgi:hypothetical protein